MMRRISLSQRLTLLFILLMMLCAAVACAVQLYSSMQYGNAMVQRLSGGGTHGCRPTGDNWEGAADRAG